MSFAPGTPASYQNQAYGNWANSQGYFQPPSQGTPYGAGPDATARMQLLRDAYGAYTPQPPKAPSIPSYGQAQPTQPPSQGTPYGAYKPHPPPHDPLKQKAWQRAAAGLAPGLLGY
jgi:hypothetical protein